MGLLRGGLTGGCTLQAVERSHAFLTAVEALREKAVAMPSTAQAVSRRAAGSHAMTRPLCVCRVVRSTHFWLRLVCLPHKARSFSPSPLHPHLCRCWPFIPGACRCHCHHQSGGATCQRGRTSAGGSSAAACQPEPDGGTGRLPVGPGRRQQLLRLSRPTPSYFLLGGSIFPLLLVGPGVKT